MPIASRPVSRRTALTLGAAGVATLAACGAGGNDRSGSPAMVAKDPDAALVDEAITQISAAAAVADQVPQLSALHAAHLRVLEAEPSDAPTRAPATPAQVRQTERALRDFLVAASMRAESGPLARLFASMSAAVSQQLVALPRAAS